MPRHASLACMWAVFVWARLAGAQSAPCPRGDGAWVEVSFAGPAWTVALREAILSELRVELGRRALQVCATAGQTVSPPQRVVTLLANDTERVSILPADLKSEGGFVGRTVLVGAIPDDARALAVAQAVDEALRSDPAAPNEPVAPASQPAVVEHKLPEPPVSTLVAGAALAPTLLVAPPVFEGATRTILAPGVLLRLSLRSAQVGGSLGIALTRASDLAFSAAEIRQVRVPLDLSLRLRAHAGALEGVLDVGALAALVDYDRTATARGYRHVEVGGRAGLHVAWGRRVVPWLGVSVEVLPSSVELKLAPTGTFGHTPQLWLGIALGTEVRWP